MPPLLRQRHNAALGLFYQSSFGQRSNLGLRPLSLSHVLAITHGCLMMKAVLISVYL